MGSRGAQRRPRLIEVAPVVLDHDVASLIIKQRAPSSLAAKITGMRSAVTFSSTGASPTQ